MKKIIILIVAVLVVVGVVVSKRSGSERGETIKIGGAFALTGDASSWGEAEKNGVTLALQDINNKGGIDGRKVELIIEDTKSSSKDSISAVQKLISVDNVKYIIGTTWLDSYPGAQGLVKNKDVILITPSASINAVQGNDPISNVFAVWYRVDAITEGLVKTMKERGINKVSLVFQNDAYYTEFIDYLKKSALKYGIEVVSENLLNPGQSDFKTIFTKIKSEKVESVVFGMYDDEMTFGFLKDHKIIAPDVRLYSNEQVRQYVSNDNYKNYINGIVFVENTKPSSDFINKYKGVYSKDPELSAGTTYDTFNILVQAIRNSDDVVGYIKKKTFDTVSFGKITFDQIGGVVTENKQYDVKEVVDGQIK
jgi:branched-chain amino acid transport system substrate-binding protein